MSADRLNKAFDGLRARREGALVAFVTAGDPFPDRTADVVEAVAAGGADVVELGIPFSDPLADGPVIQAASLRALRGGTTPPKVLEAVAEVRARGIETPIVLMGSWNPVMQYGPERFAEDAVHAGADGTILTDLSPDEAQAWCSSCRERGLSTVFLLAPTSTAERMRLVGSVGSGFLYCVSQTGITGVKDVVPSDLPPLVASIREHAGGLPVCVGFGISKPEQVRAICGFADGAVVGSSLVTLLHESRDLDAARAYIAELKAATKP
ncbi:MAG: tryptophan synthase subunit alpha [Armatimonadota bacterium]